MKRLLALLALLLPMVGSAQNGGTTFVVPYAAGGTTNTIGGGTNGLINVFTNGVNVGTATNLNYTFGAGGAFVTNASGNVSINIGIGGVTNAVLTNLASNPYTGYTNLPVSSTNASTLAGFTNLLWGRTLFVDPINGNNATALRGDASKPFLTISNANANAQFGDTIWLRPGTNLWGTNTVTMNHGVSLIGQDERTCVIWFSGTQTNSGPAIVPGSDAVFANFTIKAYPPADAPAAPAMGVMVDIPSQATRGFTNTVFRDMTIEGEIDTFSCVPGTNNPCYYEMHGVNHITKWDMVRQYNNSNTVSYWFGCKFYGNCSGTTNENNNIPGVLEALSAVRMNGGVMRFYGCEFILTNFSSSGRVIEVEDSVFISTVDVFNCGVTMAGISGDPLSPEIPWVMSGAFGTFSRTNSTLRLHGQDQEARFVEMAAAGRNTYYGYPFEQNIIIADNTTRTNVLPRADLCYEGHTLRIAADGYTTAVTNVYIRTLNGQKIVNAASRYNGPTQTNISTVGGSVTLRVLGTNWQIVGAYP